MARLLRQAPRSGGPAGGAHAISRLLVPLDGSREAETAISPALRIARRLRTPLELLTVYDPVRGRWAHDIDDVAARQAYDDVEVTCVGAGWAGDVLIDMVAEHPGAIVCMATHQRDQFARLVVGSITEHVLRSAVAPVLTVGPGYRPRWEPDAYTTTVACLDGGPRDDTTMAVASDWARQLELNVELAHVASDSARTDAMSARLNNIAADLNRDGLLATTTVHTGDDPASGITALLAERPGAIAVLASHGRAALTRLVLGSVSAQLLETSPVPLLLTRAP